MTFIINSPTDVRTGIETGQSWEAGFKVNKNTQEIKQMKDENKNVVKPLLANGDKEILLRANGGDGIGHQQLWSRIQTALDSLMSSEHDLILLKDLYNTYCVYEVDGKLYQRGYTLDENNQVKLSDNVTEVQEQTSFTPIGPTASMASDHVKPMSALGFNFGR